MESTLTKNQTRTFRAEWSDAEGEHVLIATVRYDDRCGNGHNTFSVTGEHYNGNSRRDGTAKTRTGHTVGLSSAGCIHDEIAAHLPELAPLLKWHLCSSDGPMHYVQNTVFLAGVRDCWGLKAGEVRQYSRAIKFEGFPFTFKKDSAFIDWLESTLPIGGPLFQDLDIVPVPHGPNADGINYKFGDNYTFAGFPVNKWHECPFKTYQEAEQWREALALIKFEIKQTPTAWGDGKARELDAARGAAIWPDATDEELSQEPEALKAALLARLPRLMAEFRQAVESLGFTF